MALQDDSSQWICFVDSDDWIHPRYLELLLEAAVTRKTILSACSYTKLSDYAENFQTGNYEITNLSPEDFWEKDYIAATIPVGKLYAKELFSTVRYPAGKVHEDEFVTYRLLFSAESIAWIETPLYYYFINENGIMRSHWTPGRLAGLEAYLEQVQFFSENGYSRAYRSQAMRFVRLCGRDLERLERYTGDPEERLDLQKRWLYTLRAFVKEHRSQLSFSGNPRGMIYSIPGCYWLCVWCRKMLRSKRSMLEYHDNK